MKQPSCDQCYRTALHGYTKCHAHQVNIRCEVPTCNEWVGTPYTTCLKHTNMLQMIGQEPLLLMATRNQYLSNRLRSPLDNMDQARDHTKLRFSASVAERYHNCHGSANLAEAIPGFEFPERNDKGMKGEGTRLHNLFELGIKSGRLLAVADLLMLIADKWGPKRLKFLQDERTYLTEWFMLHKSAPPLEAKQVLDSIYIEEPLLDTDGNETSETKMVGAPPKRIRFVADALTYVASLLVDMGPDTEILSEVKATAEWLTTGPKTTVDLILKNPSRMEVLDLKMGEIEITPIDNQQLLYYAATFGGLNYDSVTLHILQRNHIDSWEVKQDYLRSWAESVQDSERSILEGDLTLTAGNHCKFCPANPHTRGDFGSKACPVMMTLLYGERDIEVSDESVLADDDDWE